MKGHDGIIFVLCLFLCFCLPQMYKIQQMSVMSKQKVRLNMYLDTAVESAAYGNFDVTNGNFSWRKDEVINSFERELKNMFNISMEDFPVFLIRQGSEAYFYSKGEWLFVDLGINKQEAVFKLKETMEQLLDCSIVSSVFIPIDNESDYCNPISDYSIFAVLQLKKSVYVVSGSCVSSDLI